MNKTIKNLLLVTIMTFVSQLSFAATTPEVPAYTKTLLIFDLHSHQKPSFMKFLQGKNVALVTHNATTHNGKNIMQSEEFLTKVFNEYILANKHALKKLDKDQDGIIASSEPDFDQLALLHLVKNKEKGLQQVVEPLCKYGVRKIILNGKYISLQPEKRKKDEQYVAGVVILADGSSREILDIVTGQQ